MSQINNVKADVTQDISEIKDELNKRIPLIYAIPQLQDVISEIKTDVKEIKNFLITQK